MSQMKVVHRVIAGDTNAEAAAALFLSKRTIDTHLRNIYRRLRITSREELRQLMERADDDELTPPASQLSVPIAPGP